MEEKKVADVRTIMGELIGGFFLYGFLFAIIYNMLMIPFLKTDSYILVGIMTVIIQGIGAFLIWQFSIRTTFRKRAINYSDVQTVIKYLLIFTVIICVVNGIYTYSSFKKKETAISETLDTYGRLIGSITEENEMTDYKELREEYDKKVKEIYTCIAIVEIGLLIVYLGAVPLQKSTIEKYAV